MKNKIALVTGGSGFLGRKLCALLQENGFSVRSLARNTHADMKEKGIEQICGDITHTNKVDEAVKNCDVVFHTAALAGIWGSSKQYEKINIDGANCLMEASKKAGVKNFIYTSSPSVIFDGEDQINIDEKTGYPNSYLCDYSRTKAKAEQNVLGSNTKFFKTISLRPHLIWGVGDNHLVPRLLERARRGDLKIIGSGKNKVDMVHVDNAAWAHIDAYHALVDGHKGGERYFITNDEPVEMWGWLNALLKKLERSPVERKVPVSLAYGVASCLELIHKITFNEKDPKLTRFVVRQLSTHHTYNISKAKKDLNYKIRTSMADGLDELIMNIRNTM